MPQIDEEVKEWFMDMCQGFADAKMVVQDKGAKESATIFLPVFLQKEFEWNKQFATVQYMGGSTIKSSHYDTFEIRFYREGLERAGIEDIVEIKRTMRKQEWNGPNPYYRYNIYDIDDFNKYVKPILLDIYKRLCERLGEIYSNALTEEVPISLRELPRYKKKDILKPSDER